MCNSEPAVTVGILAGGKSTRMGRNKALLPFGGSAAIEILVKELGCFPELLISAAEAAPYAYLGLPVVCDENRDIGPIEGLRRLLSSARESHVFVCATDMVFLKRDMVRFLAGLISPEFDCWVVTRGDFPEPLCAVYSKRVLPVAEALIRERQYRPRMIFGRCRTQYVPLEETGLDPGMLRNINTPEEYREACRLLKE